MQRTRKIGRQLCLIFLYGLAAALFAWSAIGYWINANIEARALLAARGVGLQPPQVVILSVDKLSLLRLRQSLTNNSSSVASLKACLSIEDLATLQSSINLEAVPRGLYRCLLERATPQSPTAMVFDVNFTEARPDDEGFARTIQDAGNVFLFTAIHAPNGETGLVIVKRPVPVLVDAAAGTGHFRVGGGGLTRTFQPTVYAGIEPLPVILASRLDPSIKTGDAPLYFDFVGASNAVRTVSIADYILGVPSAQIEPGDVVFIGHSDPESIEKTDHFRTPADTFGGEFIAGVELMATAYINLREGRQKVYLSFPSVVGLSIALALAMNVIVTLRRWRWLLGYAALLTASALAAWGLYLLGYFAPVLAPLIVVVGIFELWRSVTTNARLSAALGTLLPGFAREAFIQGDVISTDRIRATVAFCDLVGSTSIAEAIGADEFSGLVQSYYQVATACVEGEDGDMVDFLGDGFIAIFREMPVGPSTSSRAFAAFQSLATDLASLKVGETNIKVSSRIGVCTGSVRAGAFGGERRIKVTAMGDAMNTAARLEEYAKPILAELKETPIVLIAADKASVDAQSGPIFPVAEYGSIKLRGKSEDTLVYTMAFYKT